MGMWVHVVKRDGAEYRYWSEQTTAAMAVLEALESYGPHCKIEAGVKHA